MTPTPQTDAIHTETTATVTTAALPERIDADNADTVLQILVAQAGESVDLSTVTYCDSAGVAVLLEAKSIWADQGKSIIYCHPERQLQDLAAFLKVTGLLFED